MSLNLNDKKPTWIVDLIFLRSSVICRWNVPLVTTFLFILVWASPLVTIVSRLQNNNNCMFKQELSLIYIYINQTYCNNSLF